MILRRALDGNSLNRRSLVFQPVSRSGPKDIEKNQVVVVRRDTREKIVVSLDDIAVKLREILEQEQQDMYDRAKEFLDNHIDTAVTMDEMVRSSKQIVVS